MAQHSDRHMHLMRQAAILEAVLACSALVRELAPSHAVCNIVTLLHVHAERPCTCTSIRLTAQKKPTLKVMAMSMLK